MRRLFLAFLGARLLTSCIPLCLGALVASSGDLAAAEPLNVVVATKLYADLAEQIGGAAVVTSVVERGGVPPASASKAKIIVCAGRLDAWLCETARHRLPDVAVLQIPQKERDSRVDASFRWYDTATQSAFAETIADAVSKRRPDVAPQVAMHLREFMQDIEAIQARIKKLSGDYKGAAVIVTDAMSREVAEYLHFKPNVIERGSDLENREGSILLYDRDAATDKIRSLAASAQEAGIPVVALQEKMPKGLHYQIWATRQWSAINGALNEASP